MKHFYKLETSPAQVNMEDPESYAGPACKLEHMHVAQHECSKGNLYMYIMS